MGGIFTIHRWKWVENINVVLLGDELVVRDRSEVVRVVQHLRKKCALWLVSGQSVSTQMKCMAGR